MAHDYTTTDIIKNARARLRNIATTLTARQERFPGSEAAEVAELLQAELGGLTADLEQHLAIIGGDPLRYDDGRPVVSMVKLTDDGRHGVVLVWDPRPDHPVNRHHVAASVPLEDGTVADVVVSAPGVLDVVRRSDSGGG